MPSDADIDRVLAGINPTLRAQHRMMLSAGEVIAVPVDSATLVYVIEGELRAVRPVGLSADSGSPASLAAGDAALFGGGEPGSFVADSHAFVLMSSLDFSSLSDGARLMLPRVLTVRDLPGNEPAVAALAAKLGPEITGNPLRPSAVGPSVLCQMMATTVLLSVIRTWAVRGCAPTGWPSRTNDPFLDRVLEEIDANPGNEWRIEDLARSGAMSRSAFAERFRMALGTSPGRYVGEARIRSAQLLLAQGKGISEVSRATGYASDEGFSRAFQRRVGLTPSAWRSDALQKTAS